MYILLYIINLGRPIWGDLDFLGSPQAPAAEEDPIRDCIGSTASWREIVKRCPPNCFPWSPCVAHALR